MGAAIYKVAMYPLFPYLRGMGRMEPSWIQADTYIWTYGGSGGTVGVHKGGAGYMLSSPHLSRIYLPSISFIRIKGSLNRDKLFTVLLPAFLSG